MSLCEEEIVNNVVESLLEDVSNSADSSANTTNFSLKAQKSGLGALLANLRKSNIPSSSTEGEPLSKIIKIEEKSVGKPMNRKERRALKQAELKENFQARKEVANSVPVVPAPLIYEKATPPKLILSHSDESSFQNYNASFGYARTRKNNYVRFSLLSKSGNYAAVASQDRYIRVFNMENPKEYAWKHNMGGLIYDMTWLKTSAENELLATTSKDHPIHVWDSKTGERVGAYIGRNHADAVEAAFCVNQVGDLIIGGYGKDFKIWNIERGGKPLYNIPYFDKNYNSGLCGRAMSIDACPTIDRVFGAVGCSDRVVIYSEQWNSAITTIPTQSRGFTHVLYSKDGTKIYAAERKGNIHCFDLRMNMLCQVLVRDFNSNHRAVFDIDFDHRILYSGTSKGEIVAYDIGEFNEEINPIMTMKIASTCVPCVSYQSDRLVACSGERMFPDDAILADTDDENEYKMDSVTLYPANSFQMFDVLF